MNMSAPPAIPDEYCTLSTCSLNQAHFTYIPSLSGNTFFCSLFSFILLTQVFLGIHYKTWGFTCGIFCGLLLEVIGYAGRIQMHYNPFTSNPFLMSLVSLTLGPAFLSASIYLCLARIIVVFGPAISRFRPATYTITFVLCDFMSLLLQAAGGAIASGANTKSFYNTGVHIMIGGLSTQVASLTLFMALCVEFAYRCYQRSTDWDPAFSTLRATRLFKAFLTALATATVTIYIRSLFRVAELSQGFNGKLANQQVSFMILEGAMIVLATISLTICHPGIAFQGQWNEANFSLKKSKGDIDPERQDTLLESRVSKEEDGRPTTNSAVHADMVRWPSFGN